MMICPYLSDLFRGSDDLGVRLEEVHDGIDSGLRTTAEIHGVAAGSHVLDTLSEDGTGQNGSGGRTITSNLVGLGSDILDESMRKNGRIYDESCRPKREENGKLPGTQVLELVLESNGLGDSDTILGNLGRAVGLLDKDVAALGAKGDSNRLGKHVNASQETSATVNAKLDLLVGRVQTVEDAGRRAAGAKTGRLECFSGQAVHCRLLCEGRENAFKSTQMEPGYSK